MPETAKRASVVFIYVILSLSTLLVFSQVRSFSLINHDDNGYVTENAHVQGGLTPSGIVWAFTTCYLGYWQPLTWLSLMLNCQLFGPDPGWMHLVNVLLHLANTLLLFAVVKKMTGALWPSAFVAAAFALHPMHVESVAWVSERKDVLSAFFLLLTLAAYLSYVGKRSVARYLLTMLLFVAGLLAKPMLVTLPLLLLLLDYWPLNRLSVQNRYRILVEKVPLFIICAIAGVVTFLTQKMGGGLADTTAVPWLDRVASVPASYAIYVGKAFWPHDLAIPYPLPAAGSIAWAEVLAGVLLLTGVSLVVYRLRSGRRFAFVGWFWFVVTLIPVIGLVRFTASSYADRFTYVPYIGLFIMVAWGLPELLAQWRHRRVVLSSLAVVVLVAMGVCAYRQTGYWRDSLTLFSHAIEVTQNNYIAYNGRGVAYRDLGRPEEAMADLNQAMSIKPDYPEAYYNLGAVYYGLGRYQDAFDAYERGAKLAPSWAEAHYNRGLACMRLGRLQEAVTDYGRAIMVRPDWADAYYNRGITYIKLGSHREAMDDLRTVIGIRPDDPDARFNLANELVVQGRCDEAVEQYRAALRFRPDWPDCMNNLAFVIAAYPQVKDRDASEAVELAARACRLTNEKNPAFMDTLAVAYASAARFADAVNTAGKALKLAQDANQPQLSDSIRQHLSLYEQGKPYIEPVPARPQ